MDGPSPIEEVMMMEQTKINVVLESLGHKDHDTTVCMVFFSTTAHDNP